MWLDKTKHKEYHALCAERRVLAERRDVLQAELEKVNARVFELVPLIWRLAEEICAEIAAFDGYGSGVPGQTKRTAARLHEAWLKETPEGRAEAAKVT